MVSLLLLALVVFVSGVSAQNYQGHDDGQGHSNLPVSFSYKNGAVITCSSAYASSANYGRACYIWTSCCGNWTLDPPQPPNPAQYVVASANGNGLLWCNGQTPSGCELSVQTPPNPVPPVPPSPKYPENHNEGSFAMRVGGTNLSNRCEITMTISIPPNLKANQPALFTFDTGNLGGGYANIHSGGRVDWGDGTTDSFVNVPSDYLPFTRLQAFRQTLTHTYPTTIPNKISAWMQGDFKDLPGSYRCRAQRWDSITLAP